MSFSKLAKRRGEPKEFWLSLACEDNKLQMLLPAGNPQRKAKVLWKEELQAKNSGLKELGNVCICVYVPFRLKAPVTSKML